LESNRSRNEREREEVLRSVEEAVEAVHWESQQSEKSRQEKDYETNNNARWKQ